MDQSNVEFPKDKGCLLFMPITRLFQEFAQNHVLKDFEILVVSRDITTNSVYKNGTSVTYTSKYDNIDFVPSLLPAPLVLELGYGVSGERQSVAFQEAYDDQLTKEDAMKDILSIIDMVVRDHLHVIILCTNLDLQVGYLPYLKEFLSDRFGFNMYDLDDVYDPEVDIFDIGDEETIKRQWKMYYEDWSGSSNVEEFMNFYTDSLIGKFQSILENKTLEELQHQAYQNQIWVNKNWPKETVIEAILDHYRPGKASDFRLL